MKTIVRLPKYLAWLRKQPCAICGRHGPSQACHVRRGTDGGMGIKPSDNFAFPMCIYCHNEQHWIGEETFEAANGNLLDKCAEHFERWKTA